jgi:hypothetical protein
MRALNVETLTLTIGVLTGMNLWDDSQVEVLLHRLLIASCYTREFNDNLAYTAERLEKTMESFSKLHPEITLNLVG